MQKEEAAALHGDQKAALLVTSHFFAAGPTTDIEKWTLIAAENGDAVSQYNYATILLAKGQVEAARRAHFWLVQAAKGSNNKDIISLIRELDPSALTEAEK